MERMRMCINVKARRLQRRVGGTTETIGEEGGGRAVRGEEDVR